MDNSLTVKILDISTLSEQVSVYRRAFEVEEPTEKIEEYWLNKHYKNPIHSSYVFGVYAENTLVSINAYMPLEYMYKGKKIRVIESCESGTIPEYRGRGIWSMVLKYATAYFVNEGSYDFIMGFPNYRNSYGGFIKLQWSEVDKVQNYIMVNNGSTLAKCVSGERRNRFLTY